MPRLSSFIREHSEEILAAWESFARQLPAAGSMDVEALRDHAHGMLEVIADDLEVPQTERERADKARGARDADGNAPMSAASKHGHERAESGFSVESMVAEFRALRASVISLWRERVGRAGDAELEEMTRFNEAIDQAIAQSIAQYTREVERARERILAVLGHDLRTPLGAILTTSQFLLETADLDDSHRQLVVGMERSGRRMTELVTDLLDLALTRFGDRIPIERAELDLAELVRDVVAEVVASHPGSRIEVEATGTLVGAWDRARLGQALTNLVANAVQHGSSDAPITVAARGDQQEAVSVSVANSGPRIPREQIGGIFDAMKGKADGRRDRRHLGLGLYIVNKIVEAHGGSIDIQSSEEQGTAFVVSLPRRH